MTEKSPQYFANRMSYLVDDNVYISAVQPVHNMNWRKNMKRRLISLVIVMMVCLTLTGNTLALRGDDLITQPKSSIVITCGLSKSGSKYKVWSRTETSFSDSLTASVSLYQDVNGTEVFVTSASATGSGITLTASKTRSLPSGTYSVYGSGSAGSSSGSDSCTIVVP